MLKKILIYFVIIVSGIIFGIISFISPQENTIWLFLTFIPFHVISLIFYRETKTITYYHILQILSIFGYFMIFEFPNSFRLFGLISFVGGFITFLLAFGAILQHKSEKLNERSFFWFSIYTMLFWSLYQPLILNLFINFFGPEELAIRTTITVFNVVRSSLIVLNVVLQIMIVRSNEWNILLSKMTRPISSSYDLDDLPFFQDNIKEEI